MASIQTDHMVEYLTLQVWHFLSVLGVDGFRQQRVQVNAHLLLTVLFILHLQEFSGKEINKAEYISPLHLITKWNTKWSIFTWSNPSHDFLKRSRQEKLIKKFLCLSKRVTGCYGGFTFMCGNCLTQGSNNNDHNLTYLIQIWIYLHYIITIIDYVALLKVHVPHWRAQRPP